MLEIVKNSVKILFCKFLEAFEIFAEIFPPDFEFRTLTRESKTMLKTRISP